MFFTEKTSPTLKKYREEKQGILREKLRELLGQLPEKCTTLFNRMYGDVDSIKEKDIPWAICQAENTIEKFRKEKENA